MSEQAGATMSLKVGSGEPVPPAAAAEQGFAGDARFAEGPQFLN